MDHPQHSFSRQAPSRSGNIAKPVLDVIIYNAKLSQNVGAEGLIALTVIVQISAALRKRLAQVYRCVDTDHDRAPSHPRSQMGDPSLRALRR